MSDKRYRYWLVGSGEAADKLSEWFAIGDTFVRAFKAFKRKYKCQRFIEVFGKVRAVEFKESPDPKLWRKYQHRGFWFPKISCKIGKSIAEELAAMRPGSSGVLGELFLGQSGAMIGGFMFCSPGIEKIGDKYVISATDDGTAGWKPVKGLRELKQSEYWRMKEKTKERAA